MDISFLTLLQIDLPRFAVGSSWWVWAVLATITVVIINAILMGISHSFNMRELEIYSRSEILQALATFVMVAFLVVMVGQVNFFVAQKFFDCTDAGGGVLTCATLSCAGQPYTLSDTTVALDVFKCNVMDKAQVFSEAHNAAINGGKGLLVDMSQYVSILGIPIFQGGMVTSWFKELESYRIIINLTTNLLIASNALIVVINYVEQNMLVFFLPLGMVLRSFHFTRSIGAFLIAMSLGFYFIFPIVYTVSDPTFVKPTIPSNPNTAVTQLACYPSFSGIVSNAFFALKSAGRTAGSLTVRSLATQISSIYTLFLLHPFIAFAVTLIFVRYMMYILGGEAQDMMRFVAKVV